MQLTPGKRRGLELISDDDQVVLATAMDQRGSLGKMLHSFNNNITYEEGLSQFKKGLSHVLGNQSSSLLLDPEYGWEAASQLNEDVGLIMAYEKTGYDTSEKGRLPRLVDNYTVEDLKVKGASAVKVLIYYDHEEEAQYNQIKNTLIKRVGAECKQHDMLFILEPVAYSSEGYGSKSAEFAKRKPAIVQFFMEEFSKPEYGIDLLKVEVPVSIYHVEGYTQYDNYEPVFSQDKAADFYRACSEKSQLPFIYLSGGVTNDQFIDTLHFAREAGAQFSGSLCGRAIWKEGVQPFAEEGEEAYYNWLRTTGAENLKKVQTAIKQTAIPWTQFVE